LNDKRKRYAETKTVKSGFLPEPVFASISHIAEIIIFWTVTDDKEQLLDVYWTVKFS